MTSKKKKATGSLKAGTLLEYQLVDIQKLTPYANNAKKHPPKQVEQIAGSMQQFGAINPLITDSSFEIIAGHARKELLRMLERATKGTDKMKLDLYSVLADNEERRIKASANPGSLEFFNAKYEHYMSRKHLRKIIGGPKFIYMPGEPIIDEDWTAFMQEYQRLKDNPDLILPWPPKYPSDDME